MTITNGHHGHFAREMVMKFLIGFRVRAMRRLRRGGKVGTEN
jgi:hypothetical protein